MGSIVPCPADTDWRVSDLAVRSSRAASGGREGLGDQERQLEGLAAVQPRVAGGLVPELEAVLGETFRTPDALGDVVTGELDVHPTGPGTDCPVHVEEPADLLDHVIEGTRLDAGRGLERVAMHRVAHPDDVVTAGRDLLHDRPQCGADVLRAHPRD